VRGRGWLAHAQADVRAGRLPERALVELQLPTLRDRSLAPPGGHCLSVFVPLVPARPAEGGWDRLRDRLGDLLLARAAEAVPSVADIAVARVVHTPADLEARVGLPGGAIHHLPHDPAHMGAARPGPRTALRRLYLCGAGTHPGGEISGAPGVNAARVVLADLEIAGAEALV
jgi:phytoene dehydrogenase-like protein